MKTRVVAFVARTSAPAQQAARIFKPFCADTYQTVPIALFARDTAAVAANLANADIIVYLSKRVYDEASSRFQTDPRKSVIWHLAGNTIGDTILKKKCSALMQTLASTSWVDIVDDDDHNTGIALPLAWAVERGLRKRGVHVVLIDSNGNVIVEKRSKTIVFSPGMLDITLGGLVDAGEAPMTAARRETFEELGVRLQPGQLRPLLVEKVDSWRSSYGVMDRTYRYAYAAHLKPEQEKYILQDDEVDGIAFLSPHATKRLLRTHYLRGMGPLNTTYKFYRQVVHRALAYNRAVKYGKKRRHRVK